MQQPPDAAPPRYVWTARALQGLVVARRSNMSDTMIAELAEIAPAEVGRAFAAMKDRNLIAAAEWLNAPPVGAQVEWAPAPSTRADCLVIPRATPRWRAPAVAPPIGNRSERSRREDLPALPAPEAPWRAQMLKPVNDRVVAWCSHFLRRGMRLGELAWMFDRDEAALRDALGLC